MFQKLQTVLTPGQCTMTLCAQLGVMVNQKTWIPQQNFPAGYFDFDQIQIALRLDDDAHPVMPNCVTEIKFNDSTNLTHHVMTVTVNGLDQSCHKAIDSIGDCAVMVLFQQFKIENLSMMQLIQDHAQGIDCQQQAFVPSEYQGINGTWTLEFSCPIYQWLLEYHKNLLYYH